MAKACSTLASIAAIRCSISLMVSPALGSSRHCAPDDENGNATPRRDVCGLMCLLPRLSIGLSFTPLPLTPHWARVSSKAPFVGATTTS